MPKHPRLHRLNVYLEKPQVQKLKAVAKSDKISESAVVRKGIDALPDPRRPKIAQ